MERADIALIISVILLCVTLIEKLFGGGKNYASGLHQLEVRINANVEAIKNSLQAKVETVEHNYRTGYDAIQVNINTLRDAMNSFRLKLAEDYMKTDHFKDATADLKRDLKEQFGELKNYVKASFDETKEELDAMQRSIEAARKERGEHT